LNKSPIVGVPAAASEYSFITEASSSESFALIDKQLAKKQPHLALQDVELAVKCMLEQMSQSLSTNERIEVRGFGSFSLHHRKPRMGRNPKTGDAVSLTEKSHR
jgi:integration host factor beta subunit